MASYWKSQPRKFCEICKCWIGDNKASIDFHERGKSHQEKKRKQLEQIKKRSMQQAKINDKADMYLKQMEQAAKKQYLKDLKEQGIVVNEQEYFKKEESIKIKEEKPAKVHKLQKIAVKDTQNQSSSKSHETYSPPKCNKSSSESLNSPPFGKWTTVEKVPGTVEQQSCTLMAAKSSPPKIDFKEKRAFLPADDSVENVSFKKRKTNKGNRSIRNRLENE